MRAIALGLLLAVSTSHVQASDLQVTSAFGLEFGGDVLDSAVTTSGETRSIAAGNGFYLNVGGRYPLTGNGSLNAEASLGWKYTGLSGSNGSASLSRFPLELLADFAMGSQHFAAGVTRHLAISFAGDGALSYMGAPLDSDWGFVVAWNLALSDQLGMGIKYSTLSYRDTSSGKTYDAGSFGFQMNGGF